MLIHKESIANSIIKHTNQEGARVFKEKWICIDMKEYKQFLGLLLLIGVYKSKNEAVMELWNQENGRPIFSQTMARNRFTMLLRTLRFDDATARRLQKVQIK